MNVARFGCWEPDLHGCEDNGHVDGQVALASQANLSHKKINFCIDPREGLREAAYRKRLGFSGAASHVPSSPVRRAVRDTTGFGHGFGQIPANATSQKTST
ncbi:hypothetical protein MHUMG1_10280 [Metarhizium humberi]|uniref:Uncharacterized protein n=1 Tax=Metarhizium humberi TaxID=2596975 RepID=A0A9P8M4L3_9HYPO|nr:hypothetical protein MHUMG1_10280 [Metarhizium humberi]